MVLVAVAVAVIAKIVSAMQFAAHAKRNTLYGRSYGSKSKFFRLDGLLLFPIIMGLRCARFVRWKFCCIHLARGDYSRALNFKMAASLFDNVTEEVINAIAENSIPRSAKDAIKFGVTRSITKVWRFFWSSLQTFSTSRKGWCLFK